MPNSISEPDSQSTNKDTIMRASLSFAWLTINQNLGLQTIENAFGFFGQNVTSMNVGIFICFIHQYNAYIYKGKNIYRRDMG